ncbi:MAG: DNA polymerase III subunit delta [Peptococcaceae bacterium]|nr:DNA polymerase III subunit delta [Peptococcaceae bacterium]
MDYYLEFLEELKNKKTYPVYLFYGQETYLHSEAIKKIKSFLISDHGDNELSFTELDGEAMTLSEIVSLADSSPIFTERRLLIVKNIKSFEIGKRKSSPVRESEDDENNREPSIEVKSEEKALIEYLLSPNPTTHLILSAGEQVDKRKKIFREITNIGKAIDFSLLNSSHLNSWLNKKAKEAGKKLSPGVSETIIKRTGNKLDSLSVEIKKILAYTGSKTQVTLTDLEAITVTPLEDNIFHILDAMGERKPAMAIAGIDALIKQKYPPPLILSMIARQIRLILKVKDALNSGNNFYDLAAAFKIKPFVVKKIASQQKNFSQQQLLKSIHSLHNLDVSIKSGNQEFMTGIKMYILETFY